MSNAGNDVVKKLLALDWDFADQGSEIGPHSIHPFPAKFIPQIPRQILSVVPMPERTIVLDPFAGSGTTLLEAKLGGYDYAGVDINPIAVLISKVKTTDLPDGVLEFTTRVTTRAKQRFFKDRNVSLPDIPRIDHWFDPDVARALTCLSDEMSEPRCTTATSDFLRLCLSAITVKVSRQESETRYAAIEKRIAGADVFDLFSKTASSNAKKLGLSRTLFAPKRGSGEVHCFDSRQITELHLPKVSLVITSPPYPNAYEYWLYNKYRMYWLGFDPVSVREKEIGARPHYSGPRGRSIEAFLGDIAESFRGVFTHLVRGAYVALIIGSKCTIRKTVFDLPTLVKQTLERLGYRCLGCTERSIPRTRKAFNPSIGSIESEALLIFRWEKS